jgi:hypothetical protein
MFGAATPFWLQGMMPATPAMAPAAAGAMGAGAAAYTPQMAQAGMMSRLPMQDMVAAGGGGAGGFAGMMSNPAVQSGLLSVGSALLPQGSPFQRGATALNAFPQSQLAVQSINDAAAAQQRAQAQMMQQFFQQQAGMGVGGAMAPAAAPGVQQKTTGAGASGGSPPQSQLGGMGQPAAIAPMPMQGGLAGAAPNFPLAPWPFR